MAVDQRNLPAFLGNDDEFRTWGSGIAAQMVAAGLVKTQDSGQIDWATVLRPAINVAAGYEIYRFNDTLQATKPIFIKINYGIGAVADRPSIWWQVGTGSNGAGAIAGQVGTFFRQFTNYSKGAGAVLPSYCSGVNAGAEGRFAMMTHADGTNANFAYLAVIERTHDDNGKDTGDGIYTFFGYASNTAANTTFQLQMIPFSGAVPPPGIGSSPPFDGSLSTFGQDVALVPVEGYLGKPCHPWLLAYMKANILAGTFVAMMLGAPRTFLAGAGVFNYSSGTLYTVAIRWE